MNISESMELLKDALRAKKPNIIANNNSYKEACVLIPIFKKEEKIHLLFTKRSNHVEHHKNQISFPGGGVDDTDVSLEDTALREAYEEIGLKREDVEILGRLDDTITYASGYIVHPFVGLIPYPYDFRINKREVDKIISVPLSFLFQEGLPKVRSIYHDGKLYNSLAFEYNGEIIWGATARIMQNFLETVSGRSSVG